MAVDFDVIVVVTSYVQSLEWDAYCWLCHMEGSESDCCCELCPRLYHKKCLGMKTDIVNCWVCPECEVCQTLSEL